MGDRQSISFTFKRAIEMGVEWIVCINKKSPTVDLWERTGLPIDLDGDKINVSVFSPFVATIVAYKMFEPEVINLYGVDMTNHPHLSAKAEKIRSDWFPLKKALNERGVEVNVFGNGLLA